MTKTDKVCVTCRFRLSDWPALRVHPLGSQAMIIQTCETCRHWGARGDHGGPENIEPKLRDAGLKYCPIIDKMGARSYRGADLERINPARLLILQCDICEAAFFVTGPRFGCIHWEGKDD